MAKPISAGRLLAQARVLYDNPDLPFAHAAATQGWQDGFTSGAAWMRRVMAHLRQERPEPVAVSFEQLGIIKYGLACCGSLLFVALISLTQAWYFLWAVVFVFYAIEAQMVFLFPLAIDGAVSGTPNSGSHLFRRSLIWTRRAGGTVRVMMIVMPLAAVMLFGGFLGQGFVRAWSLGCLAVVLWYELLRAEYNVQPA